MHRYMYHIIDYNLYYYKLCKCSNVMHYVFACIYIFCEDEEKLPQKCTNRRSAKNESFHIFLLPRLQ